MFIDTRQVDNGSAFQATVCVMGGGVAGITLALEFERRGIDCVLLESGGFEPDFEMRELYRGENVGIPYTFADRCRGDFWVAAQTVGAAGAARSRSMTWTSGRWVRDSGRSFNRDELTS